MTIKASQVWTNLAQAHIILGNHEDAYRLLLEASKINPKLWHVWRDLAIISVELEKFDTFIDAYFRLLALNNKYVNIGYLSKFVHSIIRQSKCVNNHTIKQTVDLITTLLNQEPNNAILWSFKALIIAYFDGNVTEVSCLLEQALKASNSNNEWTRNHAQVLKQIDDTKIIINTMLEINTQLASPVFCRLLSKGMAHLEKILQILYDKYRDIVKGCIRREVEHHVTELESLLFTIKQIVPNS